MKELYEEQITPKWDMEREWRLQNINNKKKELNESQSKLFYKFFMFVYSVHICRTLIVHK